MPNLVTPEGVVSYPHLFKAVLPKNAKPGDKPKYSATLLFRPAALETAEFKAMQAAVIACAQETHGAKAEALLREGALRLPFRKDVTAKGYPAEFALFINVNCGEEHPPQIVSLYAGPDGKPLPITDKREIYPGALCRFSLSVYAYGGAGTTYSPGIAFGLRNVQKIGDGPRLDGHSAASDEFGTQPAPTASDAANLAALL